MRLNVALLAEENKLQPSEHNSKNISNFPMNCTCKAEYLLFFANYLLHVSVLPVPSSGRNLVTSHMDLRSNKISP
jgi:hypothetical protein